MGEKVLRGLEFFDEFDSVENRMNVAELGSVDQGFEEEMVGFRRGIAVVRPEGIDEKREEITGVGIVVLLSFEGLESLGLVEGLVPFGLVR